MKRFSILFISLLSSYSSSAQNDYRKRAAIGAHLFWNDVEPANKRVNPGLALSYMEGLNNYIDIVANTSASFLNYPFRNRAAIAENDLLLEGTVTAYLKLLTDKHVFTPYLITGGGVSKYKIYYGAFIPVGIGLQVNFKEQFYLLLNSQYYAPITENVRAHFCYSIGIAGNIIRKKIVKRKIIPVPNRVLINPSDTDGDGIFDVDDTCPTEAGIGSLKGCPDTDGDGIADIYDACPLIAGLFKYQGCPIPDTDKDGVNNEEDSCVTEPGPSSNHGCPLVSADVIDKINIAAKNIFFKTGSAILLPKSFVALDEVAKLLADNILYRLSIEGHTDNIGMPGNNKILSENRAKAVLIYLKNKGVHEDRLNASGYGQDKPIADNGTVSGRSENRRVEINITN